MRYPAALVEGRLVRRYKRFLADVVLPDGRAFVAHLANPGSMRTCLADDAPVRLLDSGDPKRKLPWSVEQIQVDGSWIVVNTARGNQVVGEALLAGKIDGLPAPGRGVVLERERPLADGRVDFALRHVPVEGDGTVPTSTTWIEVKSATMRSGRRAVFPDSVSERATRHVGALADAVVRGDRAVLLFCVAREDVEDVAPADDIDPAYGRALRAAASAGVEVVAWRCRVDVGGVEIDRRLPVLL